MKRNPIQDIKRSTPSMHHSASSFHSHKIEESAEDITVESEPTVIKKKSNPTNFAPKRKINRKLELKTILVITGIVLFIIGIYFLSIQYGHARISIVEKREPFTFTDKIFKANRTTDSNLAFEVMIVSDSIDQEITLTESREASSKAKGIVVIYNSYSTLPQKLSINTRLVDDNGNIYFTDKAVTVPGFTMSKGKIVPGSVSIGITASVAGDKYNGEPRDFTLLGFKGTPKATKIYARSKGAITGGSAGHIYIPSSEQKGELNNIISNELKQKLTKSLEAQVPPGYILFSDSIKYESNFNPENILSSNANTKIKINGSASSIILNENDLKNSVIKSANPKISNEEFDLISIPELRNFVFKMGNDTPIINKETTSISFSLTGSGILTWKPNYDKLKLMLIGINKNDVNNIFGTNPSIHKARLTLIPPWQKTLPKNINYIKIKSD
ncbi:hypothetical protein IT400_01100 [Candidatus Nomurabacteria bacterium]|nr:hypothetical protein [Candidatus Nomurabacteria bacterium]